jgi:hypothetical protein
VCSRVGIANHHDRFGTLETPVGGILLYERSHSRDLEYTAPLEASHLIEGPGRAQPGRAGLGLHSERLEYLEDGERSYSVKD